MLNSCPACQYKLVDEPTLDFSILCACDGNNSAKLVDPAVCSGEEHLDPRSGLSSIWLMELYIDQFKDEVRSARAHQVRQQPSDPDDLWIDEPDSNDSAEPPTICCPESCKKMFAIFKKSGIFVTVCRHGFLLTICDMVQSGELMKYLIASMKKLMDVPRSTLYNVFGSNILYGYDIKCAFEKITQRSSLADNAKHLNLQDIVPAFHGHAHNRLCQVEHHSKYKVGAGKEDFETCERVFSESNALAAQIQNTTDFHRHQALDQHFSFADLDKYAALWSMLTLNVAEFIYNNYVQVLTIISTTNIFLANFHASNAALEPNFEDDLKDEHQVLQCLARKKEESSIEVDYVKALNEYDEAQPPRADKGTINQLFHKAVDDVECLVIMHLLELTKLQMSGLVGYKLRTQISKALKKYSFLAEFDLLRETDGEIQSKRWANPSYRHASTQYFEHQRANEEIHRLNVEMQDDAIDYPHAIAQLQSNDPPLAAELWLGPKSPGTRVGQVDVVCAYPYEAVPHEQDREDGDGDDTELGQQLEDVRAYIEGLDHHRVDLELAG
ncbi:uncharacterized protein EDB93DRAFT_1242949 [Suillus bovinus]|uniref:uncharacterized protein n=1 Tax=Suillus bovinus TaxID=48563 RepID=UPI001B87C94A|nr:uncharacterized protein EDB93DRAFT_1242949 [Suillus bovinus]KAG2132732.1 hypothetical protein EDB93DRAFT_1242949 [Suillus bovinus]